MKYGLGGLLFVLILWFAMACRCKKQRAAELYVIKQKGSVLPKALLSAGLWLYDRKEQIVYWIGKLYGKGTQSPNTLFDKYQAVHIRSWSEEEYELSQVKRLSLAWLVLTATCGAGLLLAVCIQNPLYSTDGEQSLLRPEKWGDTQTYHLLIDGEDAEGEIEVVVPGQASSGIAAVLEAEAVRLPGQILGENQSVEAVRFDLELPAELDGGVQVAWESSLPDVVSQSGRVNNQELETEGIMVELTAMLSYGEESLVTVIPLQILPPVKDSQYYVGRLEEILEGAGQEDREEPYLKLPGEIEGTAISYASRADNRPLYLLLAGVVLAVCIVLLHRQQVEEAYKERNLQLQAEYSKIVSELAILLHCGLPVRVCWQRMTATYQAEKESDQNRFSYALEEMQLTYRQMTGGIPEAGAYLAFGNRCGLYEYRRLGMLLEQTVRQGSKGLMTLLENEAVWAMEQRKNLARKRGEEAGTKMMLPMFMMFGVVVAVVMVPALMSF